MKQKQLLDMLMKEHHLSIDDILLDDRNVIKLFYASPIVGTVKHQVPIGTYGISECCTPYWIEMMNRVQLHNIIDLAKLIAQSRSSGTYYIYPYDKAMDLALMSYRLAWFKYYHTNSFYDVYLNTYADYYDIDGLFNTPCDVLERDVRVCDRILDSMVPTEFNNFNDYEVCRLDFLNRKLLYEVIHEMKIIRIMF